MSGAVGLFSDAECSQLQQKMTEAFTFGERGLVQSTHDHSAKCVDNNTQCLVLTKVDYEDKTFSFMHQQKQQRVNYIAKMPFARKWDMENIQHFNSELGQQSFLPQDVVYDIDTDTEHASVAPSPHIL